VKPFPSPVPVAEYLRMSTEHQQFSLENQSAALRLYAEKNNFSVVKTYVDAGKSGVVLKHRKGLAQLLRDVVEGDQPYRAILVYDVSRWGRFQDTDEAAYYEFLCKRSGFPIHYFAEIFSNDATMSSAVMKALKRAMAGEYSRELGVKVHAGQERLARLGYRQGAQPGYGLRRLLVSADGSPKQHLGDGERKSIASDRVIQVPGPREEVRCVREIYRMFIKQRMTFTAITKELNRQRIPYVGGTEWNHSGRAVHAILTHPKYAGFNVYGRSSQRLYVPSVKMPKSEWTMVPAFKALIDQATFAAAQRICESFTRNKSDNHLLDVLRTVLAKEGKLTIDLIEGTSGAPAASTYGARFGAVSRAYELIGYDGSWNRGSLENRRNVRVLRNDLIREIVATFPESISIERRGPTFRTRLRLRNGRLISVMASRCFQGYKGIIRWLIKSVPTECQLVTLVARLNTENNAFKDFFVIPPIRTCKGIVVKEDDPRLHRGIPLTDLEHFLGAAQKMSAREVPSFPVYLKNHGNPI
jgi:DNA invertase Pin-like site-specific DNA recombinase